jgi:DNA-binding CsgD family transcriptional regulator
MSPNRIIELTNLLLEASQDPSCWGAAIEKLVRLLGAEKGGIEFTEMAGGRRTIWHEYGLGPGFGEQYEKRFAALNPYLEHPNAFVAGKVVDPSAIIPPAEFRKTAFYREFLKAHDIEHLLCAVLFREHDLHGFLNVARPAKDRPFGAPEAALLQSLVPALQSALLINRTLAQLTSERSVTAGVLDRSPRGVILLDARGKVVMVSRPALAILEARDGLMFEDNGIRALLPTENVRLKKLVLEAAAGHDTAAPSPGESAMLVTRHSVSTPISVLVTPVRGSKSFPEEPRARAAVYIHDPERCPEHAPEVLKGLYGFTDAEARLAVCILRGLSLEESSVRLGITLNTARTHLKRLFTKTDTNRQGELVRVLLESPAMMHLD